MTRALMRSARVRPAWCVAGAMLLATLLGTRGAAAAQASCYFPDGSLSANDIPCRSSGTSHCCNAQAACLTSGYCMGALTGFTLSRGSCTDKNWGTGCPNRCIGSGDDPGGGSAIVWLGTANQQGDLLYCCGPIVANGSSVGCANNEEPFTLGTTSVILGVAALADATNTTSSSSSATSSPSSNNTQSGGSGGTSSGNGNCSSSSSTTTAVGAGVGVPLGVIALASIGWALWERRKRTGAARAFQNHQNSNFGMYSGGGASGLPPGGSPYSADAKIQQPYVNSPPRPPMELPLGHGRQELPAA